MSSQDDDRRRAARIDGRFFVRVFGVDEVARLREGNLSATGVYFSTEMKLGEIGSIERLTVRTADGEASVTLNCCLVRRSTVQDLWAGERVAGVAFHFLPADEDERAAVSLLLRTFSTDQVDSDDGFQARVPASLTSVSSLDETWAAQIHRVGRSALTMITDWPVQLGSQVRLAIVEEGDGAPVYLHGSVRDSEVVKVGREFRVYVDLVEGAAVDELVNAVVAPRKGGQAILQHALMGDLSRVPVDSVLNFAAFERWTGVIRLERPGEEVELSLVKGALVAWSGDEDPESLVKELLDWNAGNFGLSPGPVDGEGEDLRYWMMRAATARDHERRGE